MLSRRTSRLPWLVGAVCAAATWLHGTSAQACGVSADGVWSCSLAEHEEEERPRWHVGASAVYTSTALRFSRSVHGDQQRSAVVGEVGYAPTPRFSFQLSAGAALDGTLHMQDGRHELSAGPLVAFGVGYRLLLGKPFVMLTATLSATSATTRGPSPSFERASYDAFDLRAGVLFGTTLWDVLSPYAVARGFGGPVFWRYQGRSTVGTDTSHFQLGAGLSLVIAERVQLFIEGIPLGERALSGGAAAAW